MIRRVKGGFRVVSHRTGKNLGTFKTKNAAEARLQQLKRYRTKK